MRLKSDRPQQQTSASLLSGRHSFKREDHLPVDDIYGQCTHQNYRTEHELHQVSSTNINQLSYGKRTLQYRGADKSLARPGRKQPTATEDFDVHISYL